MRRDLLNPGVEGVIDLVVARFCQDPRRHGPVKVTNVPRFQNREHFEPADGAGSDHRDIDARFDGAAGDECMGRQLAVVGAEDGFA